MEIKQKLYIVGSNIRDNLTWIYIKTGNKREIEKKEYQTAG